MSLQTAISRFRSEPNVNNALPLATHLDDDLSPDGVSRLGTLGVHLDVHGCRDDDRAQPHHDRLRIITFDLHQQYQSS